MADDEYEKGKLREPAGGRSKPRLAFAGGEPVPSPLAAVDSTSSPESCRGEPAPRNAIKITDNMLRAAIEAMMPDRIQGFSTQSPDGKWGAPHYIRDVWKPRGEQELWRGNDDSEMAERCEMERLRLGLLAALGQSPRPEK